METINSISKEQYNAIRKAILSAATSATKDAAESYLEIARAYRSQIRHLLTDYIDEQLCSAISYAKDAAGRVNDKDRKLENMELYLYKFKSGITLT